MPKRTCIGCRHKEEQSSLCRVSRGAGGRVGIWSGIGRSAYFCQNARCFELALQKGRLERALKGPVDAAERDALRKVFECKLR
ncbi:MAG: YlxR family protein [Fimbriimonas sp.]